MKIVTKREADKLLIGSLFTPGGTLELERFDRGKYKGRPSDYVGRDVPDIAGVVAVFPCASRDKHGPFVVLRSLSKAVQS